MTPEKTGPTAEEVQDWMAFDKEIRSGGAHLYEAGFQPAKRARTVSVRDGQATTTEGPAPGNGNVVAGVWVIDVADIEEAVSWAQRIPTAKYGQVEVRPVVEYEG
jgi:hypothetical protein